MQHDPDFPPPFATASTLATKLNRSGAMPYHRSSMRILLDTWSTARTNGKRRTVVKDIGIKASYMIKVCSKGQEIDLRMNAVSVQLSCSPATSAHRSSRKVVRNRQRMYPSSTLSVCCGTFHR